MVKEIGKRIINLRENQNWSQRELAERIGINVSVMNRIELGERPLKDYELVKIANILETTSDYLLGFHTKQKKEADESHEKIEKVTQVLSIIDTIFKDPVSFKKITSEDIEEIKSHIDYILFRAIQRDDKD